MGPELELGQGLWLELELELELELGLELKLELELGLELELEDPREGGFLGREIRAASTAIKSIHHILKRTPKILHAGKFNFLGRELTDKYFDTG